MSELLTGIADLLTNEEEFGRMKDAAIVIESDRIVWIGPQRQAPDADTRTDLGGRAALPGWVDSHSHIVFAGDRGEEFEARMAGRPYAASGISTTVAATRAASTEQLLLNAHALRQEALRQGTTFLETKTGYGLDVENERRSAEVAAAAADFVTYLGAHVVPAGVPRRDYIDLVTGPMLAAVAPFVDAIDVFCEEGAFTVDESREILLAGRALGLPLKVHGNQLGHSGGVKLAVELGAMSVDHCNFMSELDVAALAASETVATFLPACDLSTRAPFGPARQILDAGGVIALASNCNPGSSFTTSMAFCVATAVLQLHLTVEEAIAAATIGSARSLGRHQGPDAIGSLRVGGFADIQVLDAPSAAYLAYRPGVPLTHSVWRRGLRDVEPLSGNPGISRG